MKKIAAVFISSLAAFSYAEDISQWNETLSENAAFFDEMLRVDSSPNGLPSPDIDTEWRWVGRTQPSVEVGSRYALSIVEVAYPGQYNDVIYSFAEKHLNDNVAVFLQVSHTEYNSLPSHEYIGTGITLNNRWRDGDGIGLGVAHARTNLHQQVYPDWEAAEMAWELSYFGNLMNRLNAQTSVYYIQHPVQNVDISDSIAAQVRVHFKF